FARLLELGARSVTARSGGLADGPEQLGLAIDQGGAGPARWHLSLSGLPVGQEAQEVGAVRQRAVDPGAPALRLGRGPTRQDEQVAGPRGGDVEQPAPLRPFPFLAARVDGAAQRAPAPAAVRAAHLEREAEI